MRGGDKPNGMKFVKTDADGGTLFSMDDRLRNGSVSKPKAIKPAAKTRATRPNLNALAEKFRKALSPKRRNELAVALGVTPKSLDSVGTGWATADDLRAMQASGAGWGEHRPDGAFTFPERDGGGKLVGFSFRASNGSKGGPSSASGAKRGLVVPTTFDDSGEPVLIVEGASDVAACVDLYLVAVGRPSNTGGAEQLSKLLVGRMVLVVGENDAKPTGAWPGRDGAMRTATQLTAALGQAVPWALPPDNAKDVRDWLTVRVANGLDLSNAEACRAAGQEFVASLRVESREAEPQKAASVAEQLVELALKMFQFGRTEKDELFAVARGGQNLAIMLKGSGDALRAKLAREYRKTTRRTPGASALLDAMNVLAGEALDGEAERVYMRLAAHGDGVVIDLADAKGRAVVVRSTGWEVVERSPILFRRTALTAALPVPECGGELTELRELLNVTDDSWPLIVGWLVAAMFPDIPHPILLLSGLQGTGKSCAARVLVSLFDPSPAPLRSEPRDAEQWAVSASGSWAVALDNLSHIPPWLSDALCKAATGDGMVKRKLYSDGDLAVLAFRRIVLLTSIDTGALRGDLSERLLLVDLEPISAEARRTEQELDAFYAAQHPRLFGALLDAVVAVLSKLPQVRPTQLPRMADFGRVLAATDATGVTVGALDRFRGQQGRLAAEVVEADSFGVVLSDFVRDRRVWQGTASELLAELHPNDNDRLPQGWPKRNGVKGRLKRLTPALAAQGVVVDFDREANVGRRRLIRLTTGKEGQDTVHNVQVAHNDVLTGAVLDELDDLSRTLSNATPDDTTGFSEQSDEADGEWGEVA